MAYYTQKVQIIKNFIICRTVIKPVLKTFFCQKQVYVVEYETEREKIDRLNRVLTIDRELRVFTDGKKIRL